MAQDKAVQRRLKAARALAGVTVAQLAERIDEAGLGTGTLGAIERGERDAQRSELVVIAEACGLPYEFFTADLADLGSGTDSAEVLEHLHRIEQMLSQLMELQQPAAPADLPDAVLARAVGRIAEGVRAEVLETSVRRERESSSRTQSAPPGK